MAARSEEIAFIVLMAAPGLWGKKTFWHQNKLWAEISGVPQGELKRIEELCDGMFEILMREEVLPEDKDSFCNIYVTLSMYLNPELRETFYPGPPDKGFLVFRTPQMRKAFQYKPTEILQNVHCPVLAMNGSLDIHIDAGENLRAIEDALKKGGNRNYRILELEDHNHLFQRCKTGMPSECARIKESISPIALNSISDWILAVTQEQIDR
jgi:hypothetical protein